MSRRYEYLSEEARRRMLGLGTLVEVLEPAELRASVAAFAREIAAFYKGERAGE